VFYLMSIYNVCVCVCWVSFVAYRFYYIHFISFLFFVGEVVFIVESD